MKKTQHEYGFDHTTIIVGKVKKTGKNHELDFVGNWYHLTSVTECTGKKQWYKTLADTGKAWDPKGKSDKPIKFSNLKEIGGNWEVKVKHAAEAGKLLMLYALEGLEANSQPQLLRLALIMETSGGGKERLQDLCQGVREGFEINTSKP